MSLSALIPLSSTKNSTLFLVEQLPPYGKQVIIMFNFAFGLRGYEKKSFIEI